MRIRDKRLYALTIIGTIAALIIMVTYNYMSFYSSMSDDMTDIGTSSLAQVSQQLEGYLTKGMEAVQTTAVSVEYMLEHGATSSEIEDLLVYKSERYAVDIDENFTGIYGVFEGVYIDGIGWIPDAGYEPKTREWYTVAKKAFGKPALVSPYVDAQTGSIMVSISKLLSDNDSVISIDITMDKIQAITDGIRLNGIGYGFVVDKNGLVVAHKNSEEKGKNYLEDSDMKAILDKVYESESTFFRHEVGGEECAIFSDTVMNDWHVVMIVSNDKMLHDVKVALGRNIAICSMISVLIIVFYSYTLTRVKHSVKLERESNIKIEQMNKNIIRALARTIDAKDRYTNGHSIRVADYSLEIAKRMNKSKEEQDRIYCAGLLHDVGKIRIPEEVINKKDKLTDEEFEQIKIHPVTGYHILKDIYDDKIVATGAKFHHERYDGKGYPNGLKGENIPEIARIICVADTYDAMASNRSYRSALPQKTVRSEIEKGKGTQFDPYIADIMLQMIEEDNEYNMKEKVSFQKTILVVDDEPMNIKMTEFIMKDEPMYEIVGASSGEDALEKLETLSVDLILLDVKMPGMDGFEMLSHIREKYSMPVVFMTGDKNIETIQKASAVGVDDYITKPFLPLALKEIVHSILNN